MAAPPAMSLPRLIAIFALFTSASAIYDSQFNRHVVGYWGPTAVPHLQQRLVHYCAETDVDQIIIKSLTTLSTATLNLGSAGLNCTRHDESAETSTPFCEQLEQDITACQVDHGKDVLLSIEGDPDEAFGDDVDAYEAAKLIWDMFGPVNTTAENRPFGRAALNGFELANFANQGQFWLDFTQSLAYFIKAAVQVKSRNAHLAAAPRCDDLRLREAKPWIFDLVQFDFITVPDNAADDAADDAEGACSFEKWHTALLGAEANWLTTLFLAIDPAMALGSERGHVIESIKHSRYLSRFGGVVFKDQARLSTMPDFAQDVSRALHRYPDPFNGDADKEAAQPDAPKAEPEQGRIELKV